MLDNAYRTHQSLGWKSNTAKTIFRLISDTNVRYGPIGLKATMALLLNKLKLSMFIKQGQETKPKQALSETSAVTYELGPLHH